MPRERELGRVLRDQRGGNSALRGELVAAKGRVEPASATFAGSAGTTRSARTLVGGSKRRGQAVSTGAGRPRALSGLERLSRLPVLNCWFPKQRSNPDACSPGALSMTGCRAENFFQIAGLR